MKIVWILWSICVGLLLSGSTLSAFAPVNFFRPEDRTLRLPFAPKTGIKFGIIGEYGCRSTGLNWEGKRRNVLQVYDDRQTAVWMVRNTIGDVNTAVEKAVYAPAVAMLGGIPGLRNSDADANYRNFNSDDSDRGYQVMMGKYREFDMTLMAGVKVLKTHGRLALNLYAPVKCVSVFDVNITDKTGSATKMPAVYLDNFVYQYLTDNLKNNVYKWSNLDLSDWRKAGWGDLLVHLDWSNRYAMEVKDFLKAITVGLRGGISCPTGVKKDVDQAFSMAFGNDDAWGVTLGATMGLDVWTKLKLGCNVDWFGLHDKKRMRRLKTHSNQNEFLLLNKGLATKHYGITWNLEPYLQLFHIVDRLSARVAYQYIAHDKDELSVSGDSGFDNSIINTAHSLQPWWVHNVIFNINYDLALRKGIYTVQLGAFYKMPINGRGIIDTHTFGGQLAVNW